MDTALIVIAIIFSLISIAGSILPALPGPMLAYAALTLTYVSDHSDLSPTFMWVMAFVTTAVFLLDYFLPSFITKRMGGSRYASTGAFIGMVVGLFLTPVGMLLGMLIGAFAGEMLYAKKGGTESIRAAFGAFLGFLLSTGMKLALCGYILYVIIASALR